MRLLIVDDEVLAIQGLIDDVPWEELQFEEILAATSYAQAVNLFRTRKIDILLCDIEMPLKSGLELVRWVREHNRDTQCILLTCHDDFQFAKEAISLECIGYILKPADTGEVVEFLKKAKSRVLEQEGRNSAGEVQAGPEEEELSGRSSQKGLDTVEIYIQKHLEQNLSIEELAAVACISPTHLSRLFKKRHNMTLVDYITEQRMKLAAELLKREELTVSQVASKTGYSNYSYFTKTFKKYAGKTPSEFRQEFLKM